MAILSAAYAHAIAFAIILSANLVGKGEGADLDPFQDWCVADTSSGALPMACIDPTKATAAHFKTSALGTPGNTSANPMGFSVTLTGPSTLPGVNTQGIVLARIDLARDGALPPHVHPRASEIAFVVKGRLLVGFVDTSNNLFSQNLKAGDVFVFPKGQLHFLANVGNSSAVAISALNSQNPGAQILSLAAFASQPEIPPGVLGKAFGISSRQVDKIRKNLVGG